MPTMNASIHDLLSGGLKLAKPIVQTGKYAAGGAPRSWPGPSLTPTFHYLGDAYEGPTHFEAIKKAKSEWGDKQVDEDLDDARKDGSVKGMFRFKDHAGRHLDRVNAGRYALKHDMLNDFGKKQIDGTPGHELVSEHLRSAGGEVTDGGAGGGGHRLKAERAALATGGEAPVGGPQGFLRDVAHIQTEPKINRAMSHLRENRKYVVADMPLNRLVGTQKQVSGDFMNPQGGAKPTEGDVHLPAVYRINGINHVTDGHHRLARAAAEGKYAHPVRFYDVDKHLKGDDQGSDQPQLLATGGEVRSLPHPETLNLPRAPTKAEMQKHGREADVPLDSARATQSAMDWRPKGERNEPGPMIKGYEDKPVAVRKETGEHLIFDGHHRTVMAKNRGETSMPMHVIDAKAYDPENAGRAASGRAGMPMRRGMSDDEMLKELREGHAEGGAPQGPQGPEGPQLHVGPIHSSVAGRTDHLPMHVPSGAYVIPADIVSAHGEGNTAAGFKVLRRAFGGTPYGKSEKPYDHQGGEYGKGDKPYDEDGGPYGEKIGKAAGGEVHEGVPIVAAGGEYVLSPEEVRGIGEGDLDLGHRVLDEFVKRSRKQLVKTLSRLPGPKRD